ncbi:hypothetical protein [Mesorhizobium helmanticense]|uniref:Uncharacterized protein n=1 Tax=Mesorhizobium helmanticense TaxID=1776423 RepID=A0A2T4J1Z1_9HYPH|nr:hypothetical protein [Mesorhizobium helmanticense]PTE11925.1 hypothetical protein C9427_02445 [Mesorhizobium helmanticense]
MAGLSRSRHLDGGLCLGNGEKRLGHIVAIGGILLKLPTKLSLEKPSPILEFRLRFLYKQPVIPDWIVT